MASSPRSDSSKKGTLAEGQFADLAVLSDDYLTCADEHVRRIESVLTVCDGKLAFYRDVLGFEVTQRFGPQAAFLSAGGYHHHIGLNTWESAGAKPPQPGTTGLYHVAILYPTRAIQAA